MEAGRRARTRLRRYGAANRLNRLGTLTYAGEGVHDPQLVRRHAGVFFRNLRAALGGEPFPYAWVPEWHKSGHGLHLHFAVGQFIARSRIDAAWGHGFVHIKRLSDLPVGSTSLGEARRAAGYLSKYVTKAFSDHPAVPGGHRYDVAQGFRPPSVRLHGRSAEDVRDQAVAQMGGVLPAVSWSSAQAEDWQAPPAVWFAWD